MVQREFLAGGKASAPAVRGSALVFATSRDVAEWPARTESARTAMQLARGSARELRRSTGWKAQVSYRPRERAGRQQSRRTRALGSGREGQSAVSNAGACFPLISGARSAVLHVTDAGALHAARLRAGAADGRVTRRMQKQVR
jgi:hypothetical protein